MDARPKKGEARFLHKILRGGDPSPSGDREEPRLRSASCPLRGPVFAENRQTPPLARVTWSSLSYAAVLSQDGTGSTRFACLTARCETLGAGPATPRWVLEQNFRITSPSPKRGELVKSRLAQNSFTSPSPSGDRVPDHDPSNTPRAPNGEGAFMTKDNYRPFVLFCQDASAITGTMG